MGNKKGLNTRTITVFHPDTDEEFELFVTYERINKDDSYDEDNLFINNDEVDIKSYEPNNEVDELPNWLTEDIVYEALYGELELDELDEDEITDEEDDYYEDDIDDESEEDDY
jgi:hypothetical protein